MVPAPRMRSCEVVIMLPLSAKAAVPERPSQLSRGAVVLNPLYSRMRKSGVAAVLLKVTVTVGVVVLVTTIFLA